MDLRERHESRWQDLQAKSSAVVVEVVVDVVGASPENFWLQIHVT